MAKNNLITTTETDKSGTVITKTKIIDVSQKLNTAPSNEEDTTEDTEEGDGKIKLTFETLYAAIHIRVYAEHFGCRKDASYEEMVECLVNNMPRVVNGFSRHLYFVDAKLHDMDYDKTDPVNPKPLKPHVHLIIHYLQRDSRGWQRNQRVGALINRLDDLGLHFRIKNADGTKGEDWNHFQSFKRLLTKGTDDTSLTAMVAYLNHDTLACKAEGKHIYPPAELDLYRWTNDLEKVKSMCEIYKKCYDYERSTKGIMITSKAEMKTYYKDLAYELGKQGGDFHSWYINLPSNIQIGGFDKLLNEWYGYGADEYLNSDIGISNTRCVVFINGAMNVGKTYTSAAVLRQMGYKVLEIEGGKTGKFDSLTSQHGAIVVSDTGLSDYLAVCDDKFTYMYRRNNSNPLWCGQYLIITFNGTLKDYVERFAKDFFFSKDEDGLFLNDSFMAFKSRVYDCVCDENGLRLANNKALAIRGSFEKQLKRHQMFKEFRDRFNEVQQSYIASLNEAKPFALVDIEKELLSDNAVNKRLSDAQKRVDKYNK